MTCEDFRAIIEKPETFLTTETASSRLAVARHINSCAPCKSLLMDQCSDYMSRISPEEYKKLLLKSASMRIADEAKALLDEENKP